MSGSLDRYRTCTTEDLVDAYRDLGGCARAIEAQRLQILAVLDEREAYRADGCLDAGQWVAVNDAVTAGEARDMVATAAALVELPAITRAAAEGRVSMAQLVPLVQVADHESDEWWAAEGPGMTPAALRARAREARLVRREEAERQHARRHLRHYRDRNGHGVRFSGLLPDEQAAVVVEGLERRAEAMPKNEQGCYDPMEIRLADALVEQSSEDLGGAGVPEVVLHVPVGVTRIVPTLADGTPVSIDVVRRLACDATARLLVENPDGTVAGYGRRRRIVPDKMRQRLHQRDRHCRWTGCTRTRGVRAHHIEEWIADLGETEEANCILLCRRHHRLVHDGGWTVTGDPNGHLDFHRPGCGTALPPAPAPAPHELLRRYGLDDAA